jgi:exodeoxyribonuclease VII large subunit
MAVRRTYSQQGSLLKLNGDTFSIKEELKKLGARYDGSQKCWFLKSTESSARQLEFLGFLSTSLPATDSLTSLGGPDDLSSVAENRTDAIWTVSQFTLYVERLFQQHLSFDFWITGEISSLKSSSGHVYFDLTEPENTEQRVLNSGRALSVSCCLWAGRIRSLSSKLSDFPLTEGLKIKIKGSCEFRKEGSRLSLIVQDLDPEFTLGDLALRRMQIVRELKRRGLYDRQRTLCQWPDFPLRVALITAAGSRAHTDFMSELSISGASFRVTLFDCLMQGEHVRRSVTDALQMIESADADQFDCIVITRGGGSRLDLRWFDDLDICKSIAYSTLPVMTAIGHFEDVSIADEVAAVAEKTPTGAARFLVNRVALGFERALARLERAARHAQQRILEERKNLVRFELRLEQAARLKLSREHDFLRTATQALRLVRNTTARPLKMGYALMSVPIDSQSDTIESRTLTADDFLTAEPPTRVRAQLWSRQKNAQVLLDLRVESVHENHTPADTSESFALAEQPN